MNKIKEKNWLWVTAYSLLILIGIFAIILNEQISYIITIIVMMFALILTYIKLWDYANRLEKTSL